MDNMDNELKEQLDNIALEINLLKKNNAQKTAEIEQKKKSANDQYANLSDS